jgi:hypothetical protein
MTDCQLFSAFDVLASFLENSPMIFFLILAISYDPFYLRFGPVWQICPQELWSCLEACIPLFLIWRILVWFWPDGRDAYVQADISGNV